MRQYKCYKCKTLTTEFEVHASKKYCMSCWQEKQLLIQECNEFDALYQYVRGEIMGYTKDMALNSQMVLRLKGLKSAQMIYTINNHNANYSYYEILIAFKFKSIEIKNMLIYKTFNNENSKFNYILKMVESSLNDIVLKLRAQDKVIEQTEQLDLGDIHLEPNYKPKTKQNKVSDVCKDMW